MASKKVKNYLQVSGHCTIARSNTFSEEVKNAVLNGHENDPRPEGKQRAVRMNLYTRHGEKVIITGRLYENGKGSLTSGTGFRIPLRGIDLVWIDEKEEDQKNPTNEEILEAMLS